MTTPNQPVDNFFAMLGFGAWQVADPKGGLGAPRGNYGQNVTDDFVKSVVKGNLGGLGTITGVDQGINQIKKQLNSMSMDTLSMLDGIIPGLKVDPKANKSDTVDFISSALNISPGSYTDQTIKQIADSLGGASVNPMNDAVAQVQGYAASTDDKHQGLVSQLSGGLTQTAASNDTTLSSADVGNAANNVAGTASTAQFLGELNSAVLAIRNNKSLMAGIDETEESNFLLSELFSGGADPVATISATASSVPVAYWRAEEYAKKGFISWIGKGFTNVTSLFLDIYKANYTTNTWDLIHTSPNQVPFIGSSWAYQIYTIPAAARIDTNAGDVFGVAWRVVGTGTHSIGGKSAGTWLTNHPSAKDPKRPASTRTGVGSLAFGSTTYSNSIPWFGIGIVSGDTPQPVFAPRTESFRTAGPFTYTIPEQFRVAGMKIDRVAVGGGGGGTGALLGIGAGGSAGDWSADTLVYGTDIPLGTTELTGVVGAQGPGGLSPGDGKQSTVTCPGAEDLAAPPGEAGAGVGKPGESPGDFEYNGVVYAGGLAQTRLGGGGNSPGGGGAVGTLLAVGGHGAPGAVFITARQQ